MYQFFDLTFAVTYPSYRNFAVSEAPRNARILDNHTLAEIAREELENQKEQSRARTAPSARERRRNWNVDDMEIKTTHGGKKIKAPGNE